MNMNKKSIIGSSYLISGSILILGCAVGNMIELIEIIAMILLFLGICITIYDLFSF